MIGQEGPAREVVGLKEVRSVGMESLSVSDDVSHFGHWES